MYATLDEFMKVEHKKLWVEREERVWKHVRAAWDKGGETAVATVIYEKPWEDETREIKSGVDGQIKPNEKYGNVGNFDARTALSCHDCGDSLKDQSGVSKYVDRGGDKRCYPCDSAREAHDPASCVADRLIFKVAGSKEERKAIVRKWRQEIERGWGFLAPALVSVNDAIREGLGTPSECLGGEEEFEILASLIEKELTEKGFTAQEAFAHAAGVQCRKIVDDSPFMKTPKPQVCLCSGCIRTGGPTRFGPHPPKPSTTSPTPPAGLWLVASPATSPTKRMDQGRQESSGPGINTSSGSLCLRGGTPKMPSLSRNSRGASKSSSPRQLPKLTAH